MSLLNDLANLLGSHSSSQKQSKQKPSPQITSDIHGPIAKPGTPETGSMLTIPQYTPNQINVYGDNAGNNSGNKWYENDATNARVPAPQTFDAPIVHVNSGWPMVTGPALQAPINPARKFRVV